MVRRKIENVILLDEYNEIRIKLTTLINEIVYFLVS